METRWIQVYPGRKFWPLDPRQEDLSLDSIAHALSLMCRYAGHITKFYSVAQHCLLVSQLCDPKDALWGLVHDASEAYLVDIPSPIKHDPRFAFYGQAEKKLMGVICDWLGLPYEMPASVKKADAWALGIEADNFLPTIVDNWTGDLGHPKKILIALEPKQVEGAYIKRFKELTNIVK
jgi:hypothetical protein